MVIVGREEGKNVVHVRWSVTGDDDSMRFDAIRTGDREGNECLGRSF